ncbi:MAG: hypothetical protein L7G90_02770 [Candidatus Nanopusillus sp.]|nr:hypothetical protein [Candidatus Nanopusillus sp.]
MVVSSIQEKEIQDILNKSVVFSEKPEILFYGKGILGIYGYLQIRNKIFYFELRIRKMEKEKEYTVTVKIGKMIVVKEFEKVT